MVMGHDLVLLLYLLLLSEFLSTLRPVFLFKELNLAHEKWRCPFLLVSLKVSILRKTTMQNVFDPTMLLFDQLASFLHLLNVTFAPVWASGML